MDDESTLNYNFLKQANKLRPKTIAPNSKMLLLPDLSDTPGGESLYHNYSYKRLQNIKTMYFISIILQLIALVIGELFSANNYSKFGFPRYTIYHIFDTTGWSLVFLLEVFFISFIIQSNNLATEIIAESLGYTVFWVYLLEIFYLVARNSINSLSLLIWGTVMLVGLTGILFFLYRRIKIRSNQNFLVSKAEYIGIHLKVSVQLGWAFINVFHHLFECTTYAGVESILGWHDSNWAILILCLAFSVGVIFLSTYRDIYVTVMLSYGLFGINYLDAFDQVCTGEYRNSCLRNVELASFVLGSTLLFLSGCILVLYYKLVCNFEK